MLKFITLIHHYFIYWLFKVFSIEVILFNFNFLLPFTYILLLKILFILALVINFMFVNYLNTSNFGFELFINYFYNSIDYGFFNFFIISNIFNIGFNFFIDFNYKNIFCLNFINNIYSHDFIVNTLLSNKLQFIHPFLFFFLINFFNLSNFKNFFFISLVNFIIFLFFIFFGIFWSNQNKFWNSWWIWDISELFILNIFLLLFNIIHFKTKHSNNITYFNLSIFIFNFFSFLYDFIFNFYLKSHEFVSANSFKTIVILLMLNYFIIELFIIIRSITISTFKLKPHISYLYFFLFLFLLKILNKNISFIFFISIIFILYYCVNLYIYFKNFKLIGAHIIFILFICDIYYRNSVGIELNIYTKFSKNNSTLDWENLFLLKSYIREVFIFEKNEDFGISIEYSFNTNNIKLINNSYEIVYLNLLKNYEFFLYLVIVGVYITTYFIRCII